MLAGSFFFVRFLLSLLSFPLRPASNQLFPFSPISLNKRRTRPGWWRWHTNTIFTINYDNVWITVLAQRTAWHSGHHVQSGRKTGRLKCSAIECTSNTDSRRARVLTSLSSPPRVVDDDVRFGRGVPSLVV